MNGKFHEADILTILGPTASGKTDVAVLLARKLGGEIISADSRQVYRRMNIGTGKDMESYGTGPNRVPVHLIDIVEPGTKYTIFDYQRDFLQAFEDICRRGRRVIVCGGSGLYLESILRGFRLSPVPPNPLLRKSLEGKSLEELTRILSSYKRLHNTTDVDSPQRAIRAIEIAEHYKREPIEDRPFPKLSSHTIGISIDRDTRRERISVRLHERLAAGMIEEVRNLLAEGIAPEDLIYYGLEYKFVTLHVLGRLSKDEMEHGLEIAIHQFAKRQMTWFRGMERRGVQIHWMTKEEIVEATTKGFL